MDLFGQPLRFLLTVQRQSLEAKSFFGHVSPMASENVQLLFMFLFQSMGQFGIVQLKLSAVFIERTIQCRRQCAIR